MFPPYYYEYRKKRKQKRIMICSIVCFLILLTLVICFTPFSMPATEVSKSTSSTKLLRTATLKLTTLYSCGHQQSRLLPLPEQLRGKTQKDCHSFHPNWHIIRFEENVIEAEEKSDSECDEHFLLTLADNKITVTRKNTPDEIIMEEKINPTVLTEEDKKILSSGISVNSEYELLEILESFR